MNELRGMEAAVYLRKSRAEDGMDTDAILRRHRETLNEYAAREGIHIIATYPEVRSGESLYSRPEMLRLLEAVEAGKYGAVLCMDLDRLSRGGTRDRGLIWETFKDSGTLIVTPSKVYDLSRESDEMLVEFGGLVANMELRQIKKRLARGKERALKEGCSITHPPYGYRRVTVGRKPTLEIYEPEARFVRLMFEWYAAGIGCTMIADRLNDMGARPHRAARFVRVSVMKIIKNPVYIGKIQWNRTKWRRKAGNLTVSPRPKKDWIMTDGIHPAIVDAELFQRCQEILAGRYKPPTFDGSVKSPLVGILKCEKCGGNLQRCPRNGVDYVRCLTRGCVRGARQDLVENYILSELRRVLAELTVNPDNTATEDIGQLERDLSAIRDAITDAEGKKTLLYDLLEDGTYTRAVFQERMTRLMDRLSALNREAGEVTARLETVRHMDRQVQAEAIRHVLEAYQDADAAGRNALLREILQVIWYNKEKTAQPADFTLRFVFKYV